MSATKTLNSNSVKNLFKAYECILANPMQMMQVHNAGRQNNTSRSIQQGPRPVIEPNTCHYDVVLYQVTDGSKISIKVISVGEMSGRRNVCRRNVCRRNVLSAKCPGCRRNVRRRIVCRRNVCRRNVRSVKCLSAKFLSANCLSAKCPSTASVSDKDYSIE